jgi:hypothetical protein
VIRLSVCRSGVGQFDIFKFPFFATYLDRIDAWSRSLQADIGFGDSLVFAWK